MTNIRHTDVYLPHSAPYHMKPTFWMYIKTQTVYFDVTYQDRICEQVNMNTYSPMNDTVAIDNELLLTQHSPLNLLPSTQTLSCSIPSAADTWGLSHFITAKSVQSFD